MDPLLKTTETQSSNSTSKKKEESKEEEEKKKIPFKQKFIQFIYQLPIKIQWLLFNIEGYLKFSFITSTIGFTFITPYIGILICILALQRQLKFVKFFGESMKKLFFNEFFYNLIYLLSFHYFSNLRNIFLFMPLMIHFWVGICEWLNIKQGKLYEQGKSYIDKTRLVKDRLLILKQKMEVGMIFLILVKCFLLKEKVWILLVYVHIIKVKYALCDNMQKAINDFYEIIRKSILDNDKVPKFIKWIVTQILKVVKYMFTFPVKKYTEQQKTQMQKEAEEKYAYKMFETYRAEQEKKEKEQQKQKNSQDPIIETEDIKEKKA